MKKIKGLLLFGLFALFGIGSSFGNTIPFYFDYFTNDGGLSSYNLNNNIKNFIPCIYTVNSRSYVADLQFYGQSCDSSFNSNYLGFNVYYDSNGNKLSYRLNATANSRPGYLFVLSSNLASENITDVGNGAYSRILAGSDCLGSDIFQNGNFCIPNFVELFTNKNYTLSSLGDIYDSDYNGVRYYKGPVSPAVGLGYSFGFVSGSGWQNDGNHYYLNTGNGDFFIFRSISFSGSQVSSYNNALLMRLNNTYNVSGSSNYELFALGFTGNINDYSFIYSIYNCPSTALNFYDCVFSEGGNISENFSYDFTSDNPYSNLIYLLTKSGPVKLNNSYSSSNNQITLSSQDGTSYYVPTYSITLNLVPVDGIDVIGPVPGGDSGGDIEPIFDYNTSVINDLIICYITSGDVCSYPLFNRQAFQSSYDVIESDWDGSFGYLYASNAYLFLKDFCLNSNIIDYPFCSQLELYSGSSIAIYYEDGLLSYDVLGDSALIEISGLTGGQLGELRCRWGDCSSFNSGLPDFIYPIESTGILYYTGEFINTGFFEDFYNLNLTGYFMKCPRSYDSNRRVFGSALIEKLGGYDPLVPLNCIIAAYNHGKSFKFLARHDLGEPVMGPATTDDHILLYGFFDVLLSFGMLSILLVLYRLIK